MNGGATVLPFRPVVADDLVADLRDRLARTRLPEAETGPDQGIGLDVVRRLLARWRDDYDWARLGERIGSVPQVRVAVDGLTHHALHVRSPRPDAVPLLLAHGWPSTPYEFLDVLPLLTEPAEGPAFHVVCPALPGYAFSDRPSETGWGPGRTADAWADLMGVLGYDRFVAQGGDWGAIVTTALAVRRPDRLLGLHLTMPTARTTDADTVDLSAFEQHGEDRTRAFRRTGSGYSRLQRTRPQTIGYALLDSPVALLAWVAEKLLAWSGRDLSGRPLLDDDAVLDVVSLYWLTGTGASAARMYAESRLGDVDDPVLVPTGCSIFADEVVRTPRSAVARRYRDLRYWAELPVGGHFAAAEVPEQFAAEVRAFAATL